MIKNIQKIVLATLLLLMIIISTMFLINKNNKIIKQEVKLNYSVTYEQAFPDPYLRRIVFNSIFKEPQFHIIDVKDFSSYRIIDQINDSEFANYSARVINKVELDKVNKVFDILNSTNKITTLQGLEYLENLLWISFRGHNIKDLSPLDNLVKLKYIDFVQNKVETIRLDNKPELLSLWLASNNIKNIDVSTNTKLEALSLGQNKLTNINVTNNPNLEILQLGLNHLKNLNIMNNSKLIKTDGISNMHLQSYPEYTIDINDMLNLEFVYNNNQVYLDRNDDLFTRVNNKYKFNKVGKHTINFHAESTGFTYPFGGTVVVNVTGGEATKYTPLITNDSRCYVNNECNIESKIYNLPTGANVTSISSCENGVERGSTLIPRSKGFTTCDTNIKFKDDSVGTYKVKIPVFEKNIKEIEPFKPIYPKSKYIEGEFAKNLLLSYSEVQDERDDYLNILNKKSKCNYETYICDTISYKIEAFYRSIGDKAISDKPIPGKAYDYFSVNNTAILDSKVKVYNSKQMEQVVRNYLNGSSLIDWQGDENQKVFYIYNQWLNGVPNILENTILRDTDGDQIPDVDDEDDDNDGVSDEQEVLYQTDPKDSTSFKVTKICYKVKG